MIRRRPVLALGAVLAIIATATGLFFALRSSDQATGGDPGRAEGGGGPDDGERPGGAPTLQALIDASCRGGGVVEVSGIHQTDETVRIEDCRDLTLRGPAVLDGSRTPRDRDQRHLSIRRSTNVVIEDITVVGGRCERPCESTSGLAANERQHGFEIAASQDVELRNVTASNVWGDGVYVTAKSFDKADVPATGIVVSDSYFSNTGRQGIAVSGVDQMLVERTVVRLANRSVFDFEAESGGTTNFTVRDSHIVMPDNATVNISCKTGGTDTMLNTGPFVFNGNRVYGKSFTVNPYNCDLPEGLVELEGNVDEVPVEEAPPPPTIPPLPGS